MSKELVSENPKLLGEWDFEKNIGFHPSDYTCGSNARIWWKCEFGHSWSAVLYSRKNCGCPTCAKNILTVGVNDLQTVNPALAKEWDTSKNGNTADSVAANSNKKAWWICKLGHSWKANIASRNNGRNCPYCSGRRVLEGFNDLQTTIPRVADKWDYSLNKGLTPKQVTAFSHHKVWWKCKRHEHSWQSTVANRSLGTDCPYCENKITEIGVNDLQTLCPDLAEQWDDKRNGTLKAEHVTLGSNRKVWWICKRGHSFTATVVARVKGGNCPYCIGKRPILGETDFRTVHPELMIEWDLGKNKKLRPEDYTSGSHKKIWWRCEEGHSWQAMIYARHIGHQCPTCQSQKDKHIITVGVNDLATTHPKIADEWDYNENELTPQQVLSGSNRKVHWKCRKHGHKWIAAVQSRTGGSQCPKCNGKTHTRTRFIF